METIEFILNGKPATYTGSGADRLLDVLTEHFDITSTKCGCREGSCGACAVILDGKLINSCLVSMGYVSGRSVMTLEGYRETERFKVVDKAFGDMSAIQCGFCTPGMVMAAEALLSANPHPTEEEIRVGISGNICRCTGYNSIVRAIKQAAEEGDGLW